ncbi:MAG: hypothetical protein MI750_16625, partial [Xanthomonadales bacterium]|nr:hypothetical protein [Xanthomonadales bacterium]
MDQEVLVTIIFAVSFIVFLTYWIGKQSVRKYIREFKDIDSAMVHKKKELEALNTEYSQLKETYEKTDQETKELQSLKGKADALQQQSDQCARQITNYSSEIEFLGVDPCAPSEERSNAQVAKSASRIALYMLKEEVKGTGDKVTKETLGSIQHSHDFFVISSCDVHAKLIEDKELKCSPQKKRRKS